MSSEVQATDFRRFLLIAAAALLLFAVILGTWCGMSLKRHQAIYALYQFQIGKLASAPGPFDTIFVGDSSLGNAVDAQLFGRLTQSKTINLALTASSGYAGSYEMMRRALAKFRPRNVVLMHAANAPKFDSDDLAQLTLLDESPSIFAGSIADMGKSFARRAAAGLQYLQLIFSVDSIKRALAASLDPPNYADVWKQDYQLQSRKVAITPALIATETLEPGVNARKLGFLSRVVELCRHEQLNCVYAHGPLLDNICASSSAYIAEANAAIRAEGLAVASGTPLCVDREQIGDLVYHVSPAAKAETTRDYAQLLAPYLR